MNKYVSNTNDNNQPCADKLQNPADWRWQMANSLRTAGQLADCFGLTQDEQHAFNNSFYGRVPFRITPFFAQKLKNLPQDAPLRRAYVPHRDESVPHAGDLADPLGEEGNMVAPGLVHTYHDRVLFLATPSCAATCRYCTRSRAAESATDYMAPAKSRWQKAIDYIAQNSEIRDVLVSGGDPLTLDDESLDWLLGRLTAIGHVEMVRLGTKVPVTMPMRITPALCSILKKNHPVFISLHVTHADELCAEVQKAVTALVDAGCPVGSQTVLLKGVNDNVESLRTLMRRLLQMRVVPYYLFQCDPVRGSGHFRTSVAKGLELIGALRGHLTGYGVPDYAIDTQGGGKIVLANDTLLGVKNGMLQLKSHKGSVMSYPDDGTGITNLRNE